jgi:hypothetical protein
MAKDDLGKNAQFQREINKLLAARLEMLREMDEILRSQSDLSEKMRETLEDTDVGALEDQFGDLRGAISDAADEAERLDGAKSGGGLFGAKQQSQGFFSGAKSGFMSMTGSIAKAATSVGKLAWSIGSKLLSVVKGTIGMAWKLFKGLAGIVWGVTKSVLSLAASLTKVAATMAVGILSVPFKIYKGLIAEATQAGGGSQYAIAKQNIVKAFGNLAGELSTSVFKGWKGMRKSLSRFGRSAGESLDEFRERVAEGLGPTLYGLRDQVKDNGDQFYALVMGLNLSKEATAGLGARMLSSGKSIGQMSVEVTKLAKTFSFITGSFKVMGKMIMEAAGDFKNFGTLSIEAIAKSTAYVTALGLEMKEVLGVLDAFDDFPDAAKKVSQLSQAFGMHVDVLEMMNAQDPASRFDALRKSFLATGKSVQNLTRQELKLLAAQTGVSEKAIKVGFSQKNQGLTLDQVNKKAAEGKKKTLSQAEAMEKLAKAIERMVKSGSRQGGIFANFLRGFTVGVKRSKEMRKMFRDIRKIIRVAYRAGKRLGKLFVAIFPGVKEFLSGYQGLFNVGRWRKAFNSLDDVFRKYAADPARNFNILSEGAMNFFKIIFPESVLKGFRIGFTAFGRIFTNIIAGMLRWIIQGLTKVMKGMVRFLSDPAYRNGFLDSLKTGFYAAGSAAGDMSSQILQPLVEVFTDASLISGFTEALFALGDAIYKHAIVPFGQWIADKVRGMINWTFGTDFKDWKEIGKFLQASWDKAKSKMMNAFNEVAKPMKKVANAMVEWGPTILVLVGALKALQFAIAANTMANKFGRGFGLPGGGGMPRGGGGQMSLPGMAPAAGAGLSMAVVGPVAIGAALVYAGVEAYGAWVNSKVEESMAKTDKFIAEQEAISAWKTSQADKKIEELKNKVIKFRTELGQLVPPETKKKVDKVSASIRLLNAAVEGAVESSTGNKLASNLKSNLLAVEKEAATFHTQKRIKNLPTGGHFSRHRWTKEDLNVHEKAGNQSKVLAANYQEVAKSLATMPRKTFNKLDKDMQDTIVTMGRLYTTASKKGIHAHEWKKMERVYKSKIAPIYIKVTQDAKKLQDLMRTGDMKAYQKEFRKMGKEMSWTQRNALIYGAAASEHFSPGRAKAMHHINNQLIEYWNLSVKLDKYKQASTAGTESLNEWQQNQKLLEGNQNALKDYATIMGLVGRVDDKHANKMQKSMTTMGTGLKYVEENAAKLQASIEKAGTLKDPVAISRAWAGINKQLFAMEDHIKKDQKNIDKYSSSTGYIVALAKASTVSTDPKTKKMVQGRIEAYILKQAEKEFKAIEAEGVMSDYIGVGYDPTKKDVETKELQAALRAAVLKNQQLLFKNIVDAQKKGKPGAPGVSAMRPEVRRVKAIVDTTPKALLDRANQIMEIVTKFTAFSPKLKEFEKTIKGLKKGKIKTAMEGIVGIINVAFDELKDMKVGAFTDPTTLIESIGTAFKGFKDLRENLVWLGYKKKLDPKKVREALKTLALSIKSAKDGIVDVVGTGGTKAPSSGAVQTTTSLVAGMLTPVKELFDRMKDLYGMGVSKDFSSKIKTKLSRVSSALKNSKQPLIDIAAEAKAIHTGVTSNFTVGGGQIHTIIEFVNKINSIKKALGNVNLGTFETKMRKVANIFSASGTSAIPLNIAPVNVNLTINIRMDAADVGGAVAPTVIRAVLDATGPGHGLKSGARVATVHPTGGAQGSSRATPFVKATTEKPTCFVAGTLISMFDGILKTIEDIMVGDIVLSYNFELDKVEGKRVTKTVNPMHDNLVKFMFDNGTSTTHTDDHPYYVINKGWASCKPEITKYHYAEHAPELFDTKLITVGDQCLLDDGITPVTLIGIQDISGDSVMTYNISVEDNNNYFADKVLVHNK